MKKNFDFLLFSEKDNQNSFYMYLPLAVTDISYSLTKEIGNTYFNLFNKINPELVRNSKPG
jgi:hypothetical protein